MGGAAARARLVEVLEPEVSRAGFDLEEVTVLRAGSRSLLRVVIDRDGGVDLDSVTAASKVVGDVLDANGDAMPGPYVLEVTSPGVDRPLTEPRHWRRAVGRLVLVVPEQGPALAGRLVAVDEEGASLETGADAGGAGGGGGDMVRVEYSGVRRAVVQVEFTAAAGGGQSRWGADGEDGP